MSISLYELNEAWFSLQRELEATNDPELREALLAGMEDLGQSIDEKREAYCIVIKNLEATKEAYHTEIARLGEKIRAIDGSIESVTTHLKRNIAEGEKWERGVHSIRWRKSESIKVLDDKLIPADFMREKITYEVDKVRIKESLKAGKEIAGVTLETKNNIQIK